MESSVKTISRPVIDRLPVGQIDDFASRQLDRVSTLAVLWTLFSFRLECLPQCFTLTLFSHFLLHYCTQYSYRYLGQ